MEDPQANNALEPNKQLNELDPAAVDPVLEVFKRDIDFGIVERNLRLTVEERAQQLVNATRFIDKYRPLATKR